MRQFLIEPIYGSLWPVVIGVAVVAAVLWFVSAPVGDARRRRWLVGLRVLAASVLLIAALGPTLVRTDTQPGDAILVVAVDTSRSMTLPDGERSDRWTTQQEAWRKLADALGRLDADLKLSLVAYDSATQTMQQPKTDALQSLKPSGELTDIGGAMLAASQLSSGQPMAGLVLMGDGTNTAPPGAVEPRAVAETLDAIGVPVWTVPIGPVTDPGSARDVAIESLPESFQMFAGNEVELAWEVRLRGLAGTDVPVRVSWVDAKGREEEALVRRAVAERALDTVAQRVALKAPPPGSYRLVVAADPQAGELNAANNRQVAFVEVREGGGRVLYLEGTPRAEQFFLRRSLLGFPDLDLTYQWIPRDTATRWPVDLGDWFRPNQFDVYILGDVDASAFGDAQLEQLTEAVAAGAGLVMLGGYQTYSAGGYADSPLAEAIPIRLDPSRRRPVGSTADADRPDQISGPVVAVPARRHPILDFGEGSAEATWRQLPPFSGANRFIGVKPIPGVQTLLESAEQEPLMVVGEYGRGRTAALAFDSTYRWWRAGLQEWHRRFWRQLLLWTLAREESADEVIRVELDARRFAPKAGTRFRAAVDSLKPSYQADLTAEVVDEAGQVMPLAIAATGGDSDEGNSIEGEIPPLAPGIYRMRVRDTRAGSTLSPQEVAFQVIDDSRELEQPVADPLYLTQLAAITSDHGGRAYSPDQIDELIETIAERRRRGEVTLVSRYRFGDGPISGWLTFLVFVGALTTEWWLRRKWGLA